MGTTVCISADTIGYPQGGGHLWAYLNWALGLRELGCGVIWLEGVSPRSRADEVRALVTALKDRLEAFGLADSLALCSRSDEPLPHGQGGECLSVEEAAEADLLLSLRYGTRPDVVRRFRRSALVDIDPGLLQIWLEERHIAVAPHDVYFTTGETVGTPDSRIPDAGLPWRHTPPCVALSWWPMAGAEPPAPFTTVTHWEGDEWVDDTDGPYRNDKRSGFLPFLDLPQRTDEPLELALCLPVGADAERARLRELGWRVEDAHAVAGTPFSYQRYIQGSRGEFSCAKPSCVRLQNAWVSDRTLCYLATGKPAVVQHTGPSRILPDGAGICRFRTVDEAVRRLNEVASDYDRQCRLARALAEEHFDARKVVSRVLEAALA